MAYNSSSAYDFELFEDNASAAVRKQRAQEVYAPANEPEIIELPKQKKSPKTKKLLKLASFILCGAVMFSIVAAFIYNQALLTETTEDLRAAQAVLDEELSVEVQLRSKLSEKYTAEYLAAYASDNLNMRKVSPSQIEYFSVYKNDVGVVHIEEESNVFVKLFNQIFGFLS